MSKRQYPRAPDLQALVGRCGGFDKITPQDWAEHDAAMHKWHRARREFTTGKPAIEGRRKRTPPNRRPMC
jgi:hypothetical protein